MKKNWIIGVIMIMSALFCSACTENKKAMEPEKTIESSKPESVGEDTDDNIVENQTAGNNTKSEIEQMAVSIEKEFIVYQGGLLCTDLAVCNDLLILKGEESNGQSVLHIMKYGNTTSDKIEMEIPLGMILTNIAVDKSGTIHALLVSESENDVCYELRKLSQQGEILEILDISENMQDISSRGGIMAVPEGMIIDGEGNYYFDTLSGTELVRVFNKAGELLCNITATNSNLNPDGIYAVEGMVCGKDGKIYATLAQAGNSQIKLVSINGTTGYMEIIAENILPDMKGRYIYIGQGTDADFLIASVGNGVYAYNIGDDKAEEIISVQEYPCDMEFVKMYFLRDGRLLIMDTSTEGINFYYLPVLKPQNKL